MSEQDTTLRDGESDGNGPERLMDVDDVAALLGIHQQTVYQMARSGELASIKVGRAWRFRPSDVAAWQNQKAAQASEATT